MTLRACVHPPRPFTLLALPRERNMCVAETRVGASRAFRSSRRVQFHCATDSGVLVASAARRPWRRASVRLVRHVTNSGQSVVMTDDDSSSKGVGAAARREWIASCVVLFTTPQRASLRDSSPEKEGHSWERVVGSIRRECVWEGESETCTVRVYGKSGSTYRTAVEGECLRRRRRCYVTAARYRPD